MILAWRAYKFLVHVNAMAEANGDAKGDVRTADCKSSFRYRKLFRTQLDDTEKQAVLWYALKHGYIDNPRSTDRYVPYIRVNDDLGLCLLTDKVFGIPYDALINTLSPYWRYGVSAILGGVAVFGWHFVQIFFKHIL